VLGSNLAASLIVEVGTAVDVRSGMTRVVSTLCHVGGAERVEWWGPAEDGSSLRLEAFDGSDRGRRHAFPLGPAGGLVVVGDRWAADLALAVTHLVPFLRRQLTAERLGQRASLLARRNEALEDFVVLVAHELKTPLCVALLEDDPSGGVQRALDLVDTLLEAARAESVAEVSASAAECLEEVLRDLGPIGGRRRREARRRVSDATDSAPARSA